jgi:hypothetical protein
MSQIVFAMTATLAVAPGTEVVRAIDIPDGMNGPPSFYLSKASVSDPANGLLFKWNQLTSVSLSAHDMFVGANQFGIVCTLTGGSSVDVDFTFVWVDEEPTHLGYWEFG